jgi:hypothetical protein
VGECLVRVFLDLVRVFLDEMRGNFLASHSICIASHAYDYIRLMVKALARGFGTLREPE